MFLSCNCFTLRVILTDPPMLRPCLFCVLSFLIHVFFAGNSMCLILFSILSAGNNKKGALNGLLPLGTGAWQPGSPGGGKDPAGRRLCVVVLRQFGCATVVYMDAFGFKDLHWLKGASRFCCFHAGDFVLHRACVGHCYCCQPYHSRAGTPSPPAQGEMRQLRLLLKMLQHS